MTRSERLAATFTGAAAGFFGGLFGVGGGIVMVPLLTGPLKRTQHEAHGTSLAVIAFTAVSAGVVYAIHGNVAWTTGLIVGAASAVTAPLGARATSRLSNTSLRRAFSAFLLLVAIRLLWSPPTGGAVVGEGLARIGVDVGIGAVIGLIAGFMGVGGGFLAVPAFLLLLGMSQQLAQGTSLLVILGSALSGGVAHARRGHVVKSLVPWLALGAVLASPLASLWVQHLPQRLLVRGFAVFLLINGVNGWLKAPTKSPAAAKVPEPAL